MSFGEELRRERELREITLREISDATKISVRYLQALESNDFSELPGGVFNRGFVRAHAQYIGIDPDGMVDAYLHEEAKQEQRIDADTDSSGMLRGTGLHGRNRVGNSGPARIWVGFALAVVVLAALGYIAWAFLLPRDSEAEPTAPQIRVPEPNRSEVSSHEKTDDRQPATSVSLPSSRHRGGAVVARILVDSPTEGRVNCDDRQTEDLEGILPGTRLELACSEFIAIDAANGAAIRLGLGQEQPRSLGAAGERVRNHRVSIPEWLAKNGGGPP